MRILIAIDRSEYSEIVIEHGLDQAVRSRADDLHFLTAVDTDEQVGAARDWLAATVRDGLETFGCADRRVTLHVRRGGPASTISAVAQELAPDLLVIGRFHSPSSVDIVPEFVDCPTLVVGLEGHVIEPQCSACRRTRRETEGQQLFCAAHAGDHIPDLVSRLPPGRLLGSRLW